MDTYNLDWMKEQVEGLEKNNWLYKIACFLICFNRRKLTYEEMYVILSRLNEKNLGEEEAKKWAFEEILNIYSYNNKHLPEK